MRRLFGGVLGAVSTGAAEFIMTEGTSGWIPLAGGVVGAAVTFAGEWAWRRIARRKKQPRDEEARSAEPAAPPNAGLPDLPLTSDEELRKAEEELRAIKAQRIEEERAAESRKLMRLITRRTFRPGSED